MNEEKCKAGAKICVNASDVILAVKGATSPVQKIHRPKLPLPTEVKHLLISNKYLNRINRVSLGL